MPWNVNIPDAQWLTPEDSRLGAYVQEVLEQDEVALDTETTGLVVYQDIPLYWSLSWGDLGRLCMPVSTLPYFRECFADPKKKWIFANAKFDMHMLANAGVFLHGEIIDTQVMHSLLYEEESHALKDMAKHVLGWRWTDFFDTFKREVIDGEKESIGGMLMRFERENRDLLLEYASNDAYGTFQIYKKLKSDLESTVIYSLYPDLYPNMWELFHKTEVPFTRVLWTCERNGVYVSPEYLKKIEGPVLEELDILERKINSTAGCVLNPRSPDQLRDYFFTQKKMRPKTYTKGGKTGIKLPSADANFLEWARDEGDVLAELILRHRDLAKTLGTYVQGLAKRTDPNGRIHTRFNQSVARTGRLSSSDPNLQNVKRPDEDEFRLRGAFQPQLGTKNTLVVGDYEQLEMRLLACATVTPEHPKGAEEMINIFLTGKDIHMGNAALVFGPVYEKKHGWRMTYEDLVHAKKVDKKLKNGEVGIDAMTEHVKLALFARQAAKAIGFG